MFSQVRPIVPLRVDQPQESEVGINKSLSAEYHKDEEEHLVESLRKTRGLPDSELETGHRANAIPTTTRRVRTTTKWWDGRATTTRMTTAMPRWKEREQRKKEEEYDKRQELKDRLNRLPEDHPAYHYYNNRGWTTTSTSFIGIVRDPYLRQEMKMGTPWSRIDWFQVQDRDEKGNLIPPIVNYPLTFVEDQRKRQVERQDKKLEERSIQPHKEEGDGYEPLVARDLFHHLEPKPFDMYLAVRSCSVVTTILFALLSGLSAGQGCK